MGSIGFFSTYLLKTKGHLLVGLVERCQDNKVGKSHPRGGGAMTIYTKFFQIHTMDANTSHVPQTGSISIYISVCPL